MLDIYMLILRLLHVVLGVFWAGSVGFVFFFLLPTVAAEGPDGARFIQTMGRVTQLTKAFPIAGGLTVLAGLLMFWRDSNGFSGTFFASAPGIVLTLGGLCGLIALVGPAAQLARVFNRTARVAAAIQAAGGPPRPEQLAEIQGLQVKVPGLYRNLGLLLAIAVICMAAFRYV